MSEIYTGESGSPYFGNNVYYRLLQNRNNLITVATLQEFDEYDYDHSKYVKDSSGEAYMFSSEELAIEKLNEWYKPEEIDYEYRRNKHNSFLTR